MSSEALLQKIAANISRPVRFMEVCGTHTVSIFRAGIRQLLPENVELVSGPGCPVCVTPNDYMDRAIAYGQQKDVIVATFGDMLKVPGTTQDLNTVRDNGGAIEIVYSPLDALQTAILNPDKKVVFLGVGFETTAPLSAAVIKTAREKNIKNFFVLSAHKRTSVIMRALLADPQVHVDGFLLPGHVCVITGGAPFSFVSQEYKIPTVIAGFEPLEILSAIYLLSRQVKNGTPLLENAYKSVVHRGGNEHAQKMIGEVFDDVTVNWRGFGAVEKSGLAINDAYAEFDAEKMVAVEPEKSRENPGCRCGEVLRGLIKPPQCPLFKKVCSPEKPSGACMVSIEGTCHAWYKYGQGKYAYGK